MKNKEDVVKGVPGKSILKGIIRAEKPCRISSLKKSLKRFMEDEISKMLVRHDQILNDIDQRSAQQAM